MHFLARQTKMTWPQCGAKHTKAGQSAENVALVSEVTLPPRMVKRNASESRASEAYSLHDTQRFRDSYWIGDVEELARVPPSDRAIEK